MAVYIFIHGFAQTGHTWDMLARSLLDQGNCVHILELCEQNCGLCLQQACTYVANSLREIAHASGVRPVLTGYSMGGRVALETLVQYGSSLPFGALVLESAGIGPKDALERKRLAARNAHWVHELRENGTEAFMEKWEKLPIFASQRELPKEVRMQLRKNRNAQPVEKLIWQLETLGHQHQSDEGTSLQALDEAAKNGLSVLYLAGMLDDTYTALARRIGKKTAHLHQRIIKNAGHNIHLEQPEQFFEILSSFAQKP